MKILIDPNAELFDTLYENTSTPYIFGLFRNLLKRVEYTGRLYRIPQTNDTIFLEQLDILVPLEHERLGLKKFSHRRTGIDKLAALGVIEKRPSKYLPKSGKNQPQVVRLNVSCELFQFKFSYNDKYVSKYEGEEVTINGVKFIKPEWLDLPEFKEDMMKWISHIRNRGKNIDREMFEDDLHKNFPDLFKFIQQECNEKPHIHNIYYASKNGSISKNNVINRCIEKGYTSFNYALSQKELLHNVVESSAKLSTNSKCKNNDKAVKVNPWKRVFNVLKTRHGILMKTVEIEAEFNALNKDAPVDFDKLVSVIETLDKSKNLTLKRIHTHYAPNKVVKTPKEEPQIGALTEQERAERDKLVALLGY